MISRLKHAFNFAAKKEKALAFTLLHRKDKLPYFLSVIPFSLDEEKIECDIYIYYSPPFTVKDLLVI